MEVRQRRQLFEPEKLTCLIRRQEPDRHRKSGRDWSFFGWFSHGSSLFVEALYLSGLQVGGRAPIRRLSQGMGSVPVFFCYMGYLRPLRVFTLRRSIRKYLRILRPLGWLRSMQCPRLFIEILCKVLPGTICRHIPTTSGRPDQPRQPHDGAICVCSVSLPKSDQQQVDEAHTPPLVLLHRATPAWRFHFCCEVVDGCSQCLCVAIPGLERCTKWEW